MRWVDTPSAGRSGFVQSRGYITRYWEDDHHEAVEIQYHAPDYAVQFMRPNNSNNYPHGFQYFKSLNEAKYWAAAIVRLS